MEGGNNDKSVANRLLKVWLLYKRFTEEPTSGTSKARNIGGIVFYLLALFASIVLICNVMFMQQNTYSDVSLDNGTWHHPPDIIICPRAGTARPTKKYLFNYDYSMMGKLNITPDELDDLAEYAREGVIGDASRQSLIKHVSLLKEIVDSFSSELHHANLVKQYWEEGGKDPLEALWIGLAFPTMFQMQKPKSRYASQQYSPAFTCGYEYRKWQCIMAEPLWVEEKLCVFYNNRKPLALITTPTGFFRDTTSLWKLPCCVPNIPLAKAVEIMERSVQVWIGNTYFDEIKMSHFQTMRPDVSERNNLNKFVGTVAYTTYHIIESNEGKETVCQPLLKLNKKFDPCKKTRMKNYWKYEYYFKKYSGNQGTIWTKMERNVIVIIQRNTFRGNDMISIAGGILGFMIGLSLFQIAAMVNRHIIKRFVQKKWLVFIVRAFLLISLVSIILFLFYYNVISSIPVFYSRYSESISYNSLKRMGGFGELYFFTHQKLEPFHYLNISKLLAYNVSFDLLRYLAISSMGSRYYWAPQFASVPPQKFARVPDWFRSKYKSIKPWTDEKANAVKNEYREIAAKFNIQPESPSMAVFQNFLIDLCLYIKYCQVNRVEVPHCCQYASFQLHDIGNPMMTWVLQLPTKYKLKGVGPGSGFQIYTDVNVGHQMQYFYPGTNDQDWRVMDEFGINYNWSSYGSHHPGRLYSGEGNFYLDALRGGIQLFTAAGKILKYGVTLRSIIKHPDARAGYCEISLNSECDFLHGHYHFMRALGQKILCSCFFCHNSHLYHKNAAVMQMWDDGRCCTPDEVFDCAIFKDKDYLLYKEILQLDSDEVTNAFGNETGQHFVKYFEACRKPLCSKILPRNSQGYWKSHKMDPTWTGTEIFISSDVVLQSVQSDKFSLVEVLALLLNDVQLVLGFSIPAVAELIFLCVSSVYQYFRKKSDITSIVTSISFIITEHLFRSVQVFFGVLKEEHENESLHVPDISIGEQQDPSALISNASMPNASRNNDNDKDMNRAGPSTITVRPMVLMEVLPNEISVPEEVEPQQIIHEVSVGNLKQNEQKEMSGKVLEVSKEKCSDNEDGVEQGEEIKGKEDDVLQRPHVAVTSMLLLLVCCMFVTTIVLIFSFSQMALSKTESSLQLIYHGQYAIPSIAICVTSNEEAERLYDNIRFSADCRILNESKKCDQLFSMLVIQQGQVCFIADNTNKLSRTARFIKTEKVDFVFKLHNYTKSSMKLWIGYLPEVDDGDVVALARYDWEIGAQNGIFYTVSEITTVTDCRKPSDVKPCEKCGMISTNQRKQCCLSDRQYAYMLNETHIKIPCFRYVYEHTLLRLSGQQKQQIQMILDSGYLERLTVYWRHGVATVISHLAGYIDLFLGVSILNIMFAVFLSFAYTVVRFF